MSSQVHFPWDRANLLLSFYSNSESPYVSVFYVCYILQVKVAGPFDNPVVKGLYDEWLGQPGSETARRFMHTKYHPVVKSIASELHNWWPAVSALTSQWRISSPVSSTKKLLYTCNQVFLQHIIINEFCRGGHRYNHMHSFVLYNWLMISCIIIQSCLSHVK